MTRSPVGGRERRPRPPPLRHPRRRRSLALPPPPHSPARLISCHDSAILAGCPAGDTGFSRAPPAASTPSRHPRPPPTAGSFPARPPPPPQSARAPQQHPPPPAPRAARPGRTPQPTRAPAMEPAAPRRRHTHQRGYAVTRNPHLNKVSPPPTWRPSGRFCSDAGPRRVPCSASPLCRLVRDPRPSVRAEWRGRPVGAAPLSVMGARGWCTSASRLGKEDVTCLQYFLASQEPSRRK